MLSDPRLYRYIPQDPPASVDALAARYARLETRASPSGHEAWLNWGVRLRATGRCVGAVQATVENEGRPVAHGRRALIAYELGVAFQGHGIATEACRRVIETLFAEWAVDEIVADVDTRNEASMRLLLRLSFDPGELRPNVDVFKGAPSDERRFTLRRGG